MEKPLPPKTVRKGSRIHSAASEARTKIPKEPKRPKNRLVKKLRYYYFRAKESKLLVKLKHKAIPYCLETSLKVIGVGIAAFIILLSLNLFNLVALSMANFLKCVALYYVIEEAKHYLRDGRRGKR